MNKNRRIKVVIYVQQSNNCVELLRLIYRNIENLRKRILIVFEIITKKNAHEYAARGIRKLPMIEYSNGSAASGLNDVITALTKLCKNGSDNDQSGGGYGARTPYIPKNNEEYLHSQIFDGVTRGTEGFNIEKEEEHDDDEGFSRIDIQKKMADYSYAVSRSDKNNRHRLGGNEYGEMPDNIRGDDDEDNKDAQIQQRMREFNQDRQAKVNIDQFKQSQQHRRAGNDGPNNATLNKPIIDEKTETSFLLGRSETTREPTLYDTMQIKPKESTRGPKSDMDLILAMLDENNYTDIGE